MSSFIKRLTRTKVFSLACITVVIFIFFTAMNPNFLAIENLNGIMNACSLSGTVAIGMACLMMSGSMDLSAGSCAAFGGVIVALLLRAGVAWPLALLLTIVAGACMGLLNAFWVNVLGIMPFISTIAMGSVFSAMAQVVTKSQDIAIADKGFMMLGTGHLWVFPMPVVIMVVLMIIYGLMLSNTKFGRQLILCGGNRTAARLAGINHKKITTIMFINCGAIAALAGAILAARMYSGAPRAASGAEMSALTAVIIGGVSFLGGGSSGMGTILVALILVNSFNNGLQTIELSSFWQYVTQGGLLIVALIVDYISENRRQKALKAASEKAALNAGKTGSGATA